MKNMKRLAATLIAALGLSVIACACGDDAPIPVFGTCFEGDEAPCTSDAGDGGDASDSSNTNNNGTTCSAPKAVCNNACVDRNIDSANCGTCSNVCPSGTTCAAGACKSGTVTDGGTTADGGCVDPLKSCGGVCKDLAWDSNNCGVCGKACTGGTTCQSGSCLPCPVGTWNCYTSCSDIRTDSANCGGCGVVCAAGKTCHAQSGPPWGVCN